VVDDSLRSKSSLSMTASAKSRISRNLLRRTASDSGEEVLAIALAGRSPEVEFTTFLLDDAACRMMLLKVGLFWVSDGDFMVFS
jgi:hypothetical protein